MLASEKLKRKTFKKYPPLCWGPAGNNISNLKPYFVSKFSALAFDLNRLPS